MTKIKRRPLFTASDQTLASMVQAGHEPAFEALVHRYRRPLLRYCRRLCNCEARAEEALQQALLNAWVALTEQTEVRDVRPWLYRVTHNAALNSMRGECSTQFSAAQLAQRIEVQPHAAVAQPVCGDDAIALHEALTDLAALPELQREVMLRTALAGDSHEEVAGALGISQDAVRGLLYRARSTLRAGLGALTPAPVLDWLTCGAQQGAGSGERMLEAASGGAVGLSGLAIKAGVIALTAGAALSGALAAGHHRSAVPQRGEGASVARQSAQVRSTARASQGPIGVDSGVARVHIGTEALASTNVRSRGSARRTGFRHLSPGEIKHARGTPGRLPSGPWLGEDGPGADRTDGSGWAAGAHNGQGWSLRSSDWGSRVPNDRFAPTQSQASGRPEGRDGPSGAQRQSSAEVQVIPSKPSTPDDGSWQEHDGQQRDVQQTQDSEQIQGRRQMQDRQQAQNGGSWESRDRG